MTRKLPLVVLLLVAPHASGAPLPQKDYSRMYDDCMGEAGATNNGTVGACSEGVSEEAKVEINLLYRKIYDRLAAESPGDAEKLEKAQKGWLSYRNAHCELAGAYVGSPMYYVCPMQVNIQRVNELRELAGE